MCLLSKSQIFQTIFAVPSNRTTNVVLSDICDFETTSCGYTQDGLDDFDWTRHFGWTQSTATGPSVDHTHSSSGMY